MIRTSRQRHLLKPGRGWRETDMRWYKISSYRMYLERLPNASVEVFDCWTRITGADLYTWENPNDLIRYLQCGGHGYHFNPERPPCTDHARLFKNSRSGEVWFISQPYDYFGDILQQLTPWLYEHHLTGEIYGPRHSWYCPGSASLIIIKGDGKNGKHIHQ